MLFFSPTPQGRLLSLRRLIWFQLPCSLPPYLFFQVPRVLPCGSHSISNTKSSLMWANLYQHKPSSFVIPIWTGAVQNFCRFSIYWISGVSPMQLCMYAFEFSFISGSQHPPTTWSFEWEHTSMSFFRLIGTGRCNLIQACVGSTYKIRARDHTHFRHVQVTFKSPSQQKE